MASPRTISTKFGAQDPNNPCNTIGCSSPQCLTYSLDLHRLDMVQFYQMVSDYFNPYSVPVPMVMTVGQIQTLLDQKPCTSFQVSIIAPDTVTTNQDIVFTVEQIQPASPLGIDSLYSVSLLTSILNTYPSATEFHFYKGFDSVWQERHIVFMVKNDNNFLYFCDYSGIEP